jgi:hypothetical protein
MSHDSCDERSMVTISEARRSTNMETEIAAEFQLLANLKYQHEKRIIELKLKLNRAKYNGNASSVGTFCASKNLKNSKYLLDTGKFSNSNERVQRWVYQIESEKRQAALGKSDVTPGRKKAAIEDRQTTFEERDVAIERREAAYDITPKGREAASDITPKGREAAYVNIRGRRDAAYEIIRGRREAVPEDTQAAFGERDASFERRDAMFERRLLDVDQRNIVS